MSYDLTFLPKPADQSWEEALAAVGSEPADLPDPEVWERLVAGARQLLGEVDTFADHDHFELVHLPTGIQLSYFAGYDPQLDLTLADAMERTRLAVATFDRIAAHQ